MRFSRIFFATAGMLAISASANNASCPSCALRQIQPADPQALAAQELQNASEVLGTPGMIQRDTLALGINVAGMFALPPILSIPSASSAAAMTSQVDAQGVWNGVGDMPGSFQAPWRFPTTNFDPTFRLDAVPGPLRAMIEPTQALWNNPIEWVGTPPAGPPLAQPQVTTATIHF